MKTVTSHRIVCNGCQAAFTSQSTSPIKFCPYCGSPSFKETITVKEETSTSKSSNQSTLSSVAKAAVCMTLVVVLISLIAFIFDFNDRAKSDYLQNEVVFGRANKEKVTFLSDTIKLGSESMELTQNPFTHKTGLKVTDAKTELNVAVPSTNKLGATIRANINFKNIGKESFNRNIKVSWKVKDMKTNSIIIDGSSYITFDTDIAPGESWTKAVDLFECTFLFSKKVIVDMRLDDVPMEPIMYK